MSEIPNNYTPFEKPKGYNSLGSYPGFDIINHKENPEKQKVIKETQQSLLKLSLEIEGINIGNIRSIDKENKRLYISDESLKSRFLKELGTHKGIQIDFTHNGELYKNMEIIFVNKNTKARNKPNNQTQNTQGVESMRGGHVILQQNGGNNKTYSINSISK